MLNQVTILGRVVEAFQDKDNLVVVVKTGQGEGRTGPWEEIVDCRFYGEMKKHGEKAEPGAAVMVTGSVKTRVGRQGGRFTGFEARYLEVKAKAKGWGDGEKSKHRDTKAPPSDAPADDDNIPF